MQSVTSVTQNSKKNLPSFKLDLSKCKQDDELVYNEEEIQNLQKELNAQNPSEAVQLEDIQIAIGSKSSG